MMLGLQVTIGGVSVALESEDIECSVEVVETLTRVLADRAQKVYADLPDAPLVADDGDDD